MKHMIYFKFMGFPRGSVVKHLPAMQETQQELQVQSLGGEGPLEEETATHSSTLAGKSPQTEQTGGLRSIGSQRVRHDSATEQQDTLIRKRLRERKSKGFLQNTRKGPRKEISPKYVETLIKCSKTPALPHTPLFSASFSFTTLLLHFLGYFKCIFVIEML